MNRRSPLESHTRTQINLRLQNLGWVLNEHDPNCNVFQEQAKTQKQNEVFGGKKPDYVLYETGTDVPIGIIEAKKPGQDLDKALLQAKERYAKPLNVPLAFAFNDTFVIAEHVGKGRPLKIDGEELQDFIDQITALRFIREGPEILSAPKDINFTREELLRIYKKTNNLLRKEGLREGYERFSTFAEILFLKLLDESDRLNEARGVKRVIEKRFCWSSFIHDYEGQRLLDFIADSVWKRLNELYGDIFSNQFAVRNPATLESVIEVIDPINLSSTDTDVKGDAFEYFLKSVTNGNKDLGEYFTPRHIVRTMVNLVKPIYGERLYDPCCGTGGFLLEAFKYLSLRVDVSNPEIIEKLKNETIYGREITSTARIAKMNMILFDDGHSNIDQIDCLSKPINEEFDVVLSNIPYSQKVDYGSFYPIPTSNGDSVFIQHIYKALKPGGRAAVIVPETFLYEDGVIGQTRELIMRDSEAFTVVSLPRGVFMPYTPTKTNIIYFKKKNINQFKNIFFFVIFNDGFELNTKRKPVKGDSDLKKLLSNLDSPKFIKAQANIVEKDTIIASGNYNLRPFYYMEDVPESKYEMVYLDETIIEESKEKINPKNNPDKIFGLLRVSQNGVFLDDVFLGDEATQSYKVVHTGDLVYNPYRVNIGSIGLVPSYYENHLVSPAYVVFRSINDEYPSSYIHSVLKTPRYQKVIMNYSLSSARANLPFSELIRIKIPKPNPDDIKQLAILEEELDKYQVQATDTQNKIIDFVESYLK